jgi:hypothetical protein
MSWRSWLARDHYPRGRRLTLFMLVLTALYIVFEAAFNAHLLDVLHKLTLQEATAAELHGVEEFGRYVSACAVALLYVGALVVLWKKGRPPMPWHWITHLTGLGHGCVGHLRDVMNVGGGLHVRYPEVRRAGP